MKQQVTLALSLTLAAGLLAGCADTTGGSQPTGAAQTSPADATPSAAQSAAFTDEMKIPHAVDLSPEDGADSVERLGDHADSPYFAHPDYYHMQSSDTLTILTGFQTMQQTSEWASRTIGYAPPDGLGKGLNIPPRQLMRDKLQYSIEGICCQLDIPLRYVPLAVVVARVRAYCAMGSS